MLLKTAEKVNQEKKNFKPGPVFPKNLYVGKLVFFKNDKLLPFSATVYPYHSWQAVGYFIQKYKVKNWDDAVINFIYTSHKEITISLLSCFNIWKKENCDQQSFSFFT